MPFMHWLMMGGYSIYVWSAYSLVFLVFIMHVFGIKIQRKYLHRKLQRWSRKP